MAVQWNLAIGARVCDVVAPSANDHADFAVDDRVIVMVGCADEALLYVLGYDGSVRVISTAEHTVTTISGSPGTAEVVSPDCQYLYTATARSIYRPSLISGPALVDPGMNVGDQERTRSLAGDVRTVIG
jgi:hypothetical protein